MTLKLINLQYSPTEKKLKKDEAPTKAKKEKASTSISVDRISELDQKWSERFNRLEALLLSKSLQPTFSSEVRVNPSHSPPTNVGRDTEPFFQPTSRTLDDSSTPQRTGPDFGAAQQPSAGKLLTDSSASGSSSSQRTGPDSTAAKQKSAGKLSTNNPASESSSVQRTGPDNTEQKLAGKLKPEHQRTKSSTGRTGPDTATARSKSTGKPHTDSHRPFSLPAQGSSASFTDPPLTDRPKSALTTGSGSPTLQKASRRDGVSSLEWIVDSDLSDRPPVELFVEEGELSDEQELTEHDLPTSEEQTYRETMRGIRSFMGWSHVPDVDSSNPSDDNPFAEPKTSGS